MPHLLKDLSIREVSSVDRGAGDGVQVVLMKRVESMDIDAYLKRNLFDELAAAAKVEKREFTDKERQAAADKGDALPDGSFPIANKSDLENAIHAYGRAKDKAKAKAHIIARAKDLDASDMIPENWTKRNFLRKALAKIGFPADPDKDSKTLEEALGEQDFCDKFWKATNALQTSINSIINDVDATDKPGMIAETLKQFTDYMTTIIPDQIGKSLAAILAEPAGEPGISKGDVMSDALKKALGLPATATDADMAAAIAKRDADLAKANADLAILKMSDKHKQYADDMGMSDDAKGKFAAKTADERDQQMKDNPVEKNLPASVIKALQDREDLQKRLADLEAKDARAALTKRAEDIGLGADGAEVLQKARSGDKAAVEKLEDALKAANAALKESGLFKELGSAKGSDGASAYDQLVGKADELRKANPKLSPDQAFSKAYEDPANADLVKQHKIEKRRAA